MRKILEYLANQGAFLYEECGCRIVDSIYHPSFGGTGSVTLVNDTIELRLWLERDRLFMDMRGLGQRRAESCSMDIIWELLTGQIIDDATMNLDNSLFLKSQFSELMKRFSPECRAETERRFKELKKRRAKRLFG